MSYTIYNKKLDHFLVHPLIGLWHTNDINEAQEMLAACQEYVRTFDSEGYEKCFVIADAETGLEICPPPEKV